ncbi:hypothetical protein RBS60_00205 [Sinomonas sp. ASV486]|uniref:DUF6414 family protein n=1 Tax=Sinomonas sp. ASV486 TaxID=3051170 RepID=UPI0027DCF887|nr:hypothetical protein [Sinomonas sp. ASV486]MDQ4488614.1 hypothetical protein [Sinomonas sp. ASV486]
MGNYKKPKVRIHREFLYLNHDTIINSLSAFESGKVDEIIQKASEASEGGLDGSIGYGPVKAGGKKTSTKNVQEELVLTRTKFSAFDAWFGHLDAADALGVLEGWDADTREELGVGETVRLEAHVALAPLYQIFNTFISFANEASNPDSVFKQKAADVAETKKTARQMLGWMKGKGDAKNILVELNPFGVSDPKVVARLDERYLVAGAQAIEGQYTIIGQIEHLLVPEEKVPSIRIIRDAPPTELETSTITEALRNFIEPAAALGVTVEESDIRLEYPTVILHPIAIFR